MPARRGNGHNVRRGRSSSRSRSRRPRSQSRQPRSPSRRPRTRSPSRFRTSPSPPVTELSSPESRSARNINFSGAFSYSDGALVAHSNEILELDKRCVFHEETGSLMQFSKIAVANLVFKPKYWSDQPPLKVDAIIWENLALSQSTCIVAVNANNQLEKATRHAACGTRIIRAVGVEKAKDVRHRAAALAFLLAIGVEEPSFLGGNVSKQLGHEYFPEMLKFVQTLKAEQTAVAPPPAVVEGKEVVPALEGMEKAMHDMREHEAELAAANEAANAEIEAIQAKFEESELTERAALRTVEAVANAEIAEVQHKLQESQADKADKLVHTRAKRKAAPPELTEARNEVRKLESELKEKDAETQVVKTQLALTRNASKFAFAEKKTIAGELAELRNQLMEAQMSARTLELSAQSSKQERDELRDELEETQTTNSLEQHLRTKKLQELTVLNEKMQNEAQAELSASLAEMHTLQRNHDLELQSDRRQHRVIVEEEQKEVAELRRAGDALRSENARLVYLAETTAELHRSLESQNDELLEQEENSSNRFRAELQSALDEELACQMRAVDWQERHLEMIKSPDVVKLKTMQTRLDLMSETLEDCEDENLNLQEELTRSKDENINLQEELIAKDVASTLFRQEVAAKRDAHEEMQNSVEEMRREIETLRVDNGGLRSGVNVVENLLAGLQSREVDLNSEEAQLNRKVRDLSHRLEQTEQVASENREKAFSEVKIGEEAEEHRQQQKEREEEIRRLQSSLGEALEKHQQELQKERQAAEQKLHAQREEAEQRLREVENEKADAAAKLKQKEASATEAKNNLLHVKVLQEGTIQGLREKLDTAQEDLQEANRKYEGIVKQAKESQKKNAKSYQNQKAELAKFEDASKKASAELERKLEQQQQQAAEEEMVAKTRQANLEARIEEAVEKILRMEKRHKTSVDSFRIVFDTREAQLKARIVESEQRESEIVLHHQKLEMKRSAEEAEKLLEAEKQHAETYRKLYSEKRAEQQAVSTSRDLQGECNALRDQQGECNALRSQVARFENIMTERSSSYNEQLRIAQDARNTLSRRLVESQTAEQEEVAELRRTEDALRSENARLASLEETTAELHRSLKSKNDELLEQAMNESKSKKTLLEKQAMNELKSQLADAVKQKTLLEKQVSKCLHVGVDRSWTEKHFQAALVEILGDRKAPWPIPLEARSSWTKADLRNYINSGGNIRPEGGCSIPQPSDYRQDKVTGAQLYQGVLAAARLIADADAIVVGSGAGMGADSGLATFRGEKGGVWNGLKSLGLSYEEMCRPEWFQTGSDSDCRLAWAFWNHCKEQYRQTDPHEGYRILREWCRQKMFSVTSNIDGFWAKSGWDPKKVWEVHGSLQQLQCASEKCTKGRSRKAKTWAAPEELGLTVDPWTYRARGDLPNCMNCQHEVARPNVLMFGRDPQFVRDYEQAQMNEFERWLQQLPVKDGKGELGSKLVCIELGCGLTVPSIREILSDIMVKYPRSVLVRVNPEDFHIENRLADDNRAISIPQSALQALQLIDKHIKAIEAGDLKMEDVRWPEVDMSQASSKRAAKRSKHRNAANLD